MVSIRARQRGHLTLREVPHRSASPGPADQGLLGATSGDRHCGRTIIGRDVRRLILRQANENIALRDEEALQRALPLITDPWPDN
jgi:hypothetical protein